MYIDKTEYETSQDLGSYLEALLKPEHEVIDRSINKTQYNTSLELGLYLEALLNPNEQDVELEVKIKAKGLNEIIVSEKEQNNGEQSQIPLWGKKPFKCLLVKLAGMKVMVPAMSVAYIERINKTIIRLPLDAEAFRGIVTLRERSIAVIDLFSLVSENTSVNNQRSIEVDTHHVENVIVMENGNYALSCDDVGEMITLETEDVRWNKASFNNPMFAGIVTEYLCPIVNIDHVQQQVAGMPFVQSLNNKY